MTKAASSESRKAALALAAHPAGAGAHHELALCLTGAGAAFVNTWVVEGADPLDPEEFADRLMRMLSVIAAAVTQAPR